MTRAERFTDDHGDTLVIEGATGIVLIAIGEGDDAPCVALDIEDALDLRHAITRAACNAGFPMSAARRLRQSARKLLGYSEPPPKARRRPTVPPTTARSYIDAASHNPPRSMTDHAGNIWRGASRIIDRPARRRAEARRWQRELAVARRSHVAAARATGFESWGAE